MKRMRVAAVLLATLALADLSACASAGKQQSAAAYVDDATITAGVKAAIRNEPSLDVSDIKVETYQGVVQLSGFVGSAANIATASTVARSVNGVKSVSNDIRLK